LMAYIVVNRLQRKVALDGYWEYDKPFRIVFLSKPIVEITIDTADVRQIRGTLNHFVISGERTEMEFSRDSAVVQYTHSATEYECDSCSHFCHETKIKTKNQLDQILSRTREAVKSDILLHVNPYVYGEAIDKGELPISADDLSENEYGHIRMDLTLECKACGARFTSMSFCVTVNSTNRVIGVRDGFWIRSDCTERFQATKHNISHP